VPLVTIASQLEQGGRGQQQSQGLRGFSRLQAAPRRSEPDSACPLSGLCCCCSAKEIRLQKGRPYWESLFILPAAETAAKPASVHAGAHQEKKPYELVVGAKELSAQCTSLTATCCRARAKSRRQNSSQQDCYASGSHSWHWLSCLDERGVMTKCLVGFLEMRFVILVQGRSHPGFAISVPEFFLVTDYRSIYRIFSKASCWGQAIACTALSLRTPANGRRAASLRSSAPFPLVRASKRST
jgi:hypothetical protein